MAPLLSILIITYNRPEDTLELLKNINNQFEINQHVQEILLLNNASTESYNIVHEFIKKHETLPINFIQHHENLGVARGRNFLIQKAKAPYLVILDDDVEFADNNAIQTIASLFNKTTYKQNNTAVITLNIFYYLTKERQQTAFPHKNYQQLKDKDLFLTYYFTGAAHVMKKEIFLKTGLYPEDFFYGMEEYDLSYRIINAGYTLAYDNSVKVWHKESPTGRVSNKEKLGMMWINKTKVAWKYLPKKYYYSTLLMWSLQYIRKTGFDLKTFLRMFKKASCIPNNNKRLSISDQSISYLKKVKARLWY